MSSIKTIVFDSYGTLFNVQFLDSVLEGYFPGKGKEINKTWRDKQVQYTFLRELINNYSPFSMVTKDSLLYALDKHDVSFKQEHIDELLAVYQHLPVFPEVKGVLSLLQNKKVVIFSDGSHNMLDPLVYYNGIQNSVTSIISVDEIKKYKPVPFVYYYLEQKIQTDPKQVLYITANGWDVSGAKVYGFKTVWVNRNNLPKERLNLPPDATYSDLTGILHWV